MLLKVEGSQCYEIFRGPVEGALGVKGLGFRI